MKNAFFDSGLRHFSDNEKVAVVIPITNEEFDLKGYKALFALCFSTLLLMCLTKITGMISNRVNDGQNFRWMSI